MIVALTGYAGVGKTTLAHALAGEARTLSFARRLKEACAILFSLHDGQIYGPAKDKISPRWGLTPRELLQRVGTACLEIDRSVFLRPTIDDALDILHYAFGDRLPAVEWLGGEAGKTLCVIDDCRYLREAKAVVASGGIVIRITRPGTGPKNQHSSEVEMSDDWGDLITATVSNDGSVDDTCALVREAIRAALRG